VENSKLLNKFFELGHQHKLLEKSPFELLTWEECINNINKHLSQDLYVKVLGDFSIATHDLSEMSKVQEILKYIKKVHPNRSQTAHMYCNISISGGTFGLHVDDQDTWIWQCAGVTKWAMHYHAHNTKDKQRTGVVIHELKPGNMLYIPKGLYHSTKPLTPRFSISFVVGDEQQ